MSLIKWLQGFFSGKKQLAENKNEYEVKTYYQEKSPTIENTKKSSTDKAETLIQELFFVSSGLSDYAFNDSKKDEMLSLFIKTEKEIINLNNPAFYYQVGVAYRNYCAWFIRGEERKQYLEKAVLYFEKAINTDPEFTQAKADLSILLIEERVVRNLDKGIKYIEELERKKQMPHYLDSYLSKAKRWRGDISVKVNYKLYKLNVTTAVLREERIKYRALLNKYKKDENDENIKETLKQLYNLAVLATLYYPNHDCHCGYSGNNYESASKLHKLSNKINYSFEENGYIKYCKFLSDNDWKNYKNIFGDTDQITDFFELLGLKKPSS